MTTLYHYAFAVASTLVLATAVPTSVMAMSNNKVSTQLFNPPVPGDPDGTCSRCQIDDMQIDTSSGDHAILELYFEDNGGDLNADIQVRVLLDNNQIHDIFVDDIDLKHQQTEVQWLSSGNNWDWDDVQVAWVQVHDAS